MARVIDLLGQTFGRLTVTDRAENSRNGQARWFCSCECGNECVVCSANLRRGLARSCSCLRNELTAERSTIHGHDRRGKITKPYYRWKNLRSRKKTVLDFPDYLTAQTSQTSEPASSLDNKDSKQNF